MFSEQELDHPLAITDVYVLPTDAASGGRMPWIFLSYVVARDSDGDGSIDGIPITETQRVDVCACVDIESFIQNLGDIVENPPYRCNLNGFFDMVRQSGIVPVMLSSPSVMESNLLLMPSLPEMEACVLQLRFVSLQRISEAQNKICFNTPNSFATNANLPTRPGWIDFQRKAWMGSEELTGTKSPAVTQQGVTVFAKRVTAQNSLSKFAESGENSKVQLFATSDPDSASHWLKQVRIGIQADDSGTRSRSVSAESKHSTQAETTITTYHRCDRISCLGCQSIKLQALCYAAQQCAVTQCVGTIVNQNRPLCNIGLMAKSYAESTLSMMMGAWLVFTESYGKILDAALVGPSAEVNVEWVDDAFFGYICSAKDTLGQMTSIVTSSVGAGN